MALPLLLISSITIITILMIIIKLHQGRRLNLPPGPPPRPIIGNLHQMKPHWTHCFWEWSRVYGPIISVWFGSELNVVVSSSDLAKQVLKENDHILANRHRGQAVEKMSQNGSDLIWTDYSLHYVKVKKICNLELFSPKSIESLKFTRETEAKAMMQSILKDMKTSEKQKIVLRNYLGETTLNTISRMVFGERLGSREGKEFKAIVHDETKLSSRITLSDHIWWLKWVSLWFNNDDEFERHLDRRTRLTRSIMEKYKAESNNGEDDEQKSFVQRLLVLQKRHELSEETVVGLLWNTVTAGMDTVAITVEWAMAELIRNQTIQLKAQQELDSVLGHSRLMSESDIMNLPYLQCIVNEALRLHPPTPLMLPHKASATVQIGGYDVPKGTTVYVNVWAVGRAPKNWRDPDKFHPERFLVEEADVKGQDFRVLPFGSGRRVCPAAQLGINMMILMLGHLLHCFSWSSQPGEEDIDMAESPGLVCYMKTPLQALASSSRLPQELYEDN